MPEGAHDPAAPPRPVRRVAVMTHGKAEAITGGLERLERVAGRAGVALLFPEDEAAKHGRPGDGEALGSADLVVVLGGDGTMLRALNRFLGTGVPVLGINFGRVGFLSAIKKDELEPALERALAGEYRVIGLPTLAAESGPLRGVAVNDVVARSSDVGRMVELGWTLGGEDLGAQPCDGVICAAPAGSTAYNLSNGGPVLVWGLEAMAVSFVAPHSLHARPLVVPRGLELAIQNRTPDVGVTVILDGHVFSELPPGAEARVRLDGRHAMLASLPESTFFRRYREIFVEAAKGL
jgi:NAD+ kinase